MIQGLGARVEVPVVLGGWNGELMMGWFTGSVGRGSFGWAVWSMVPLPVLGGRMPFYTLFFRPALCLGSAVLSASTSASWDLSIFSPQDRCSPMLGVLPGNSGSGVPRCSVPA